MQIQMGRQIYITMLTQNTIRFQPTHVKYKYKFDTLDTRTRVFFDTAFKSAAPIRAPRAAARSMQFFQAKWGQACSTWAVFSLFNGPR